MDPTSRGLSSYSILVGCPLKLGNMAGPQITDSLPFYLRSPGQPGLGAYAVIPQGRPRQEDLKFS